MDVCHEVVDEGFGVDAGVFCLGEAGDECFPGG